ncbi:MAG: sodium:alanine symporter family protein [Lagierella massiliensis]|nr:sodium:alanine symporter family protein [Lagierella massiliensis]
MQFFVKIIKFLNVVLWDYILLFGLIGLGIYMTILLKFPQFKRVLPALKKLIKDIIDKVEVPEGRMTPFQSLATAIAAQVGTGNIIGVATAVASGGPGAAFWMILSAFFGMSTIFAEAVLAQKYREVDNGDLVGGPAYYIKNGLKNKPLAYAFAFFCVIALGVVGIMVQSNSVAVSVSSSFNLPKVWVSIGLVAVVAAVLTGGMERIAGFTEKVVPVMAFAYLLGAILIVIFYRSNIIPALEMIIKGAFNPKAIGGGILGIGIQESIRFGVARGLFSNEAGMGSTPHSHAVSGTDHPAEQGFIAMIGVFISTFLICMCTVLVSLTSGSYDPTIPASTMEKTATLMTQNAFALGFGSFGEIFLSVALSFFSLTTIVGWYFFAESNVKLIVNKNKKIVSMFKFVVLGFLLYGTTLKEGFVWDLADTAMGLMALPNVIAIFFLGKEARDILKDYDKQVKSGKPLHFDYKFERE